jgi:predicted AlkP superfamily pyrophosphatase or phosphodiesterase
MGDADIAERQRVAQALIDELTPNEHIQFYTKWSLPERFHYRDNDRIADIIGVCDEHWVAFKSGPRAPWAGKGMHGYDNELNSMVCVCGFCVC